MLLWLGAYICNWLAFYLAIFLYLVVGYRPRFHSGHLASSEVSCLKGKHLPGSNSLDCLELRVRLGEVVRHPKLLIYICASLHIVINLLTYLHVRKSINRPREKRMKLGAVMNMTMKVSPSLEYIYTAVTE